MKKEIETQRERGKKQKFVLFHFKRFFIVFSPSCKTEGLNRESASILVEGEG